MTKYPSAIKCFFLLLMPVLAGSCAEKTPVDEQTYVEILTELHLIQTLDRIAGDGEMTRSLIDSVWVKYGVGEEAFFESHDYFMRDIRAQQRRMLGIAEQLDSLNAFLVERLNQLRIEETARERAKMESEAESGPELRVDGLEL